MTDILDLDTVKGGEEGATLYLKHPTEHTVLLNEDGSEMTIKLLGADSPRWRKAQRANINRRIKSGRRGLATAEELESDAIEMLAIATLDWNITVGGEKPKCSQDEARALYKKVVWVREQVDEFVGDRANFVRASTES